MNAFYAFSVSEGSEFFNAEARKAFEAMDTQKTFRFREPLTEFPDSISPALPFGHARDRPSHREKAG